MIRQTFEQYMQGVHALDYIGTDDDMPEAFDLWMEELDVDEMFAYVQYWAKLLLEDNGIKVK